MKIKEQIKFVSKEKSHFFSTLKSRVDQYFKEKKVSRHANVTMVVKSASMIAAYLFPFVLILTLQLPFGIDLILWSLMGFSVAGIGMSVMHDGLHGAYSKHKSINNLMGSTLNLLGGSVFNWKLQHNVLHHTYTNITYMDEDINDKLVLRFSPHTPVKSYYKYQWIYSFFFYGILTLYWVLLKDFIQFITYIKSGVNNNTKGQNFQVLVKIILLKLVYFFILLVFPTILLKIPFSEVIIGFLLMHFIAGIILTVVFQLAHTVEETDHPMPNPQGIIENEWAIHQLNTTVNFSPQSKWLSWYVGGLNFQIEHHLFPKVCHVHYPGISEIVKKTAQEYGIPYLENKTFFKAIRSHIAALKKFGKLPDLNEAIG